MRRHMRHLALLLLLAACTDGDEKDPVDTDDTVVDTTDTDMPPDIEPPGEEAGIKDGGPTQVHHEDEVLTQGGDPVRSEPKLGDPRHDGPEGQGVHQERADHQEEL